MLKSPGFIFQLPAMNGTRAIIWHDAVERSVLPCAAPTPAPWKTFAGATKADPAGKPASTNREVSFIVIEGGKTGQFWADRWKCVCDDRGPKCHGPRYVSIFCDIVLGPLPPILFYTFICCGVQHTVAVRVLVGCVAYARRGLCWRNDIR